ncbi:MAG: peroxiredoxin [Candidatus Sungbacteria bacterium RIFCSPLOWO2_01_FULL_59_16]|uniref:Peroxiredoxin n=1 Tax=Candidatus Sungbacteria bacterium RIFCSPLOWO2_01_FULL_59_16 TaxID=1802280 RepID=A0A1G2LB39_9BACT|nr:MAG: peroxiredoxin [Candidatus Sungbacteria bacterium RIFCSPLOWO2_01_FULL_59_16]
MFSVDQKFPEFSLEVYHPEKDDIGRITSRDFAGRWLIFFWYPKDFTFVCPTELADLNARHKEFKDDGAEILSVSTDTVYTHKGWVDAEGLLKGLKFPMAADHNGRLARELGIYDEETGVAQRAAFIIDPDGILRAVDIVADAIGRSAGELLRKLKALRFVREHPGRVCPASWDEGEETLRPSIKIAGKVAGEIAEHGSA